MHISQIEIRNFRSLRQFVAPLSRFSVIIGENDVGKTTVLYALDAFFNGKKLTKATDFFDQNTHNPVEITLTFSQDEVPKEFKEFVKTGNELRVKRVFEYDKEPRFEVLGPDGVSKDISKKSAATVADEDKFHLVPVRRSLEDQFSMTKTALLGKTFRTLMKSKLNDSDAAKSQMQVAKFLEDAISPAKEKLQILLREQMNNDSMTIEFSNLSIDPISGVSFDVTISDDKMSNIPLAQRGAGTQNCMILALYRFIASAVTSDFVLALEEPENSFHPKGQRELLAALGKLSESCQVICTTHSPVFIDRLDFRNNVILVRHPDGATTAKTLNREKLQEVRELLGVRPSDALLKGGGNFAIIAEGKSEEQAFPKLMSLCGVNDRMLGISIVPLHGYDRQKAVEYIKLLTAFDLPCGVVLDNDVPEQDVVEISRLIGDSYPSLKFVHKLNRGSLEDYYPNELLGKGIAQHLGNQVNADEIEIFEDMSGKARLKAIKKQLYQVHQISLGSLDYLKMELARTVPDWMADFGTAVDVELRELFARVEKYADS